MYLIIGLGNPEKDYAETRHNMGFNVINEISERFNIKISHNKFNGIYGTGIIEDDKVILLKPQTYMNLSGESIIKFRNFYKIPMQNIIVIYDDVDLEPGNIRIRKQGSPGTHNGMKSVTENLKTNEFKRIRVGIGKPKDNQDIIDYVIGHIPNEEKKDLLQGVKLAAEAVIYVIKNGIDKAMNKYN